MKSTTKGIILLVFLVSLLIIIWHFISPMMEERRLERTSDSGLISDEIVMAGDSWLGYYIFRSPELKTKLRKEGISLKWVDDKADYKSRMENFSLGKYDFIVATVDSYILNSYNTQPAFPGVIIAVIDQSQGGDALVAKTSVPDINALNEPNTRIALTPASPSEFLVKAIASHFNVSNLLKSPNWKIPADGAEDAYTMMKDGRVKVAALWEPYVSKALQLPDTHKLLGTDKTEGLIVDILIADRRVVDKSRKTVALFMEKYFETLDSYKQDEEKMVAQASKDTHEKKEEAKKMLEGINFVSFEENCRDWFILNNYSKGDKDQLAKAVDSTVAILIDSGDLTDDPVQGNPYTIMFSGILEDLVDDRKTDSLATPADSALAQEVVFKHLDDNSWKKLKIVGRLKIRPILFQSSNQLLTVEGKQEIDNAAEVIRHYPQFRILIKGHTSPGGDEAANSHLSEQRAAAVRQYLTSVHDVSQDRIRAVGVGSKEPLPKDPGESHRAYKFRLQRVEFIFLEDDES